MNNRLFTTDKQVLILTPADPFFWPQIGSLIQPVVIQLHYFCGIDCTSTPYSGDGLLHVDFDTSQPHIRNMALTSLNNSQLIGQLNFNLERLSKNSFLTPTPSLFSALIAPSNIFSMPRCLAQSIQHRRHCQMLRSAPLIHTLTTRSLAIFKANEPSVFRQRKLQFSQCAI